MNKSGKSIHSPPNRWVILALLLLICFVSHFNRASITIAGDERIMKQYGISPERMGMVYSSFLILYTLFMIPGGWLIDRRGPRLSLALMVAGSAVLCACTGVLGLGFIPMTSVWIALLCVRAAMGLCSSPLHPGAARSIDHWFPGSETALANGLVTGASILAYAVVHTIFGRLIDWLDWPRAFLCTGAATFSIAVAWWWISSERPRPRAHSIPTLEQIDSKATAFSPMLNQSDSSAVLHQKSTSNTQTPWRVRELTLLTMSYAAVGYFQYLFFYWLHYYFDEILRMDKVQSRYYAGLPSLAMAAAMPLGGWLMGKMESRLGQEKRFVVPLFGMLASAGCLLAGLLAVRIGWVVSWFTLALGLLGLCESAFWVTSIELGGLRAGTSAAIMNTGGNGIGLLAPVLTPLISRRFGWRGGLCVGAFVAVAGALCWLGIRRRARESP